MCCDWKVFTGPGTLGAAWEGGGGDSMTSMQIMQSCAKLSINLTDLEPVCGVLVYNVEITEDDTQNHPLSGGGLALGED